MEQRIRTFEDLIAWQKARELTKAVYAATGGEQLRRDFGLSSQMQRAAVSVMANIAEGFERKGTVEFARFLGIAKASCAEVTSHLYVALDVGYLDESSFGTLRALAQEVGRVIAGLRRSLDRQPEETSR